MPDILYNYKASYLEQEDYECEIICIQVLH